MATTPKSYSRIQSKNLTAKSMAKLLGQCSSTAWEGWTGEHRHRVFPSLLQLLLAETGSLEENLLLKGQKGLMLCKFLAVTDHFFKKPEMKFSMDLEEVVAQICGSD